MSEIVEIPFRKIRGTKEWQAEQEKLRRALRELSSDDCRLLIENPEPDTLVPLRDVVGLLTIARSRLRLAGVLAEHGQVSRVMCQERRADGRRCRYPVEEGGAMCRAHAEWRAGPLAALPFPDDALGLQRLMAKLLSGLLYGGMDPQKARVAADVCRTMRQNIEGCERAAREAEEEFFL
ncbi:MAG: hypothetical protein ACRD3A_05730 [Terriglobales bacterium]